MTRENLISREWQQNSPTYVHVTELFLESEFQHIGDKQIKKREFWANLAVSSTATDLKHKII